MSPIDPSVRLKIDDLKRNWSEFTKPERALQIEEILGGGVSRRVLAKELECSEGTIRYQLRFDDEDELPELDTHEGIFLRRPKLQPAHDQPARPVPQAARTLAAAPTLATTNPVASPTPVVTLAPGARAFPEEPVDVLVRTTRRFIDEDLHWAPWAAAGCLNLIKLANHRHKVPELLRS